jgi:hypothetical protein
VERPSRVEIGRPKRLALLALVGTTAALVLDGHAAGTIVAGQSIAGVKLGSTAAAVRRQLGAPRSIRSWRGALGSKVVRLHYPGLDVDVERVRGRQEVVAVITTRRRERTPQGIGVGSRLRILRKLLPRTRCSGSNEALVCWLGDPRVPGSRFTTFSLAAGRVVRVSVAIAVNA